MPSIDRRNFASMGLFGVSKRLPDHEAAKLYRGADIGFARRSARNNGIISYAESDDDEDGNEEDSSDEDDEDEVEEDESEEDDDEEHEEEEQSPQSDTFSDSDFEEISFEQFQVSVHGGVGSRKFEGPKVEDRKLNARKVEARRADGVDSAAGKLFKQFATEVSIYLCSTTSNRRWLSLPLHSYCGLGEELLYVGFC